MGSAVSQAHSPLLTNCFIGRGSAVGQTPIEAEWRTVMSTERSRRSRVRVGQPCKAEATKAGQLLFVAS